MRLVAFLLPLILSLRVLGKHKDDNDDSKDDTSVSASASASSSGTASAAGSTTTSLSSDTSGLTGDSQCASVRFFRHKLLFYFLPWLTRVLNGIKYTFIQIETKLLPMRIDWFELKL